MTKGKILGLIGIICSAVGFFIFGLPLNVAALVLGIVGVKDDKSALPIISIVLGAIFTVLMIIYTLLVAMGVIQAVM